MNSKIPTIVPVILSGGSGSRLWPLSRSMRPKQFIKLVDKNRSLFQLTLERIHNIEGLSHLLVVCNDNHRFTVAEQPHESWPDANYSILLEPCARNTAPAIASAAHYALESLNIENPLLLVLPADHVIQDKEKFLQSILAAERNAANGELMTFGITPDHPATGYGYIKTRPSTKEKTSKVEKFVEKPSLNKASEYLSSGDYYWNSGIFQFSAKKYLEELVDNKPGIVSHTKDAVKNADIDRDFVRLEQTSYENCENESIDYAVMEHSSDVSMVKLASSWSDVGSWSSVWDISEKDKQGNAQIGDVWSHNTENCYLHAESKIIAAIGVKDLIVIETHDGVMVTQKSCDQDVKKIVEQLVEANRPEALLHRQVYRPWGNYDSIDSGDRFQVKRITVDPGAVLSLQKHFHRAEHWVVVSGTAEVTKGEEVFLLNENESTFIPLGTAHRLRNPGKIPLEIVEIQSGAYLGEDDIERLDDIYGRHNSAIKMNIECKSDI